MIRPLRRLVVLLLLLAAATARQVPAAPRSAFSILGLDTSISAVASGGYWEQDGKRGVYRVVIVNHGFEHVSSEVWIQWIEEVPSDWNLCILSSVPLREINDQGWSVGTPEILVSKGPTRVQLHATHSLSLEKATFMLTLGKPGEYKYVQAK